ncbi:dephospho-CoA kinase [Saccharothrix coeruleofusca]|uniref:Dephospho-CoA kinase n=1 Tax=Saccharothrix coeruleofusca TaxID=33919 RepID=A0A918AMT1_9PSEU|nr:dephospho-CoA kinase [Saccharothrix coeruleofusca]MBP2338141.1 dephospho-CoA kinase [Saccharothrix coeruleofusca]GGP50491.1 dephospho-CoA kinase [Saccharothrix coeruleofusca]
MLRVGLSGGIGSGKSTVAARLVEHGAVLVDADLLAREVVEPGTEGLAEVVAAFGDGVLGAGGALDRAALAAKVFSDDEARRTLNGIIHPKVGARAAELIAAAPPDAIVVHDVPLLVENGLMPAYHLVLIVHADVEQRVARLVGGRGMDERDARNRIAAQADDARRRAAADVWLDNTGTPDQVLARVDALWVDRLVPYEANVRLRRYTPTPPRVVPYDATWPAQAERIAARIRLAAGQRRVEHIGSTAVPGLAAKDVLDFQLGVDSLETADALADALAEAGFPRLDGIDTDTPKDDGDPRRWRKRVHVGADPARRVNLHVRVEGGPAWEWALRFRDWLRADAAARQEYQELKQELAERFADHESAFAYGDAKEPWMSAAVARVEAFYQDGQVS